MKEIIEPFRIKVVEPLQFRFLLLVLVHALDDIERVERGLAAGGQVFLPQLLLFEDLGLSEEPAARRDSGTMPSAPFRSRLQTIRSISW